MENSWDNKVPPRGNMAPVDVASVPYDTREAAALGDGTKRLLILNLILRGLTLLWTAISMAILIVNKVTVDAIDLSDVSSDTQPPITIKFDVFFFLSYLLAIDTLCLTYVLVSTIMFGVYFQREFTPTTLLLSSFILDQMFAYLLMSSASGAATGIRTIASFDCADLPFADLTIQLDCPATWVTPSFITKSYGAAVIALMAFITIAMAALVTGRTWARNSP